MSTKGPDTPIVIVGNKTDLDRVVSKVMLLFTKSDNIKRFLNKMNSEQSHHVVVIYLLDGCFFSLV
jgi:hypothetical protein